MKFPLKYRVANLKFEWRFVKPPEYRLTEKDPDFIKWVTDEKIVECDTDLASMPE